MILNELPRLPPFAANQMLTNDEVINILLFGTPNSWQVEMEKQNWDPMDHTIGEAVWNGPTIHCDRIAYRRHCAVHTWHGSFCHS
jgi:hypothetical protein